MRNDIIIIGVAVVLAIAGIFVYQRFWAERLTPEKLAELQKSQQESQQESGEETSSEDAPPAETRPEAATNEVTMEALAAENPGKLYTRITTPQGPIVIELLPEVAPVTVANFVNLATHSFYDGLVFHRVIADFMIQGGDPRGTGSGGPGYQFEDECVPEVVFDKPGLLAMANAGPRTNGSQFFITHVPTTWLNGKHTIFGRVVSGQRAVDAVRQGDKMERVEVAGDYSGLFEKCKDRISEWNAKLNY